MFITPDAASGGFDRGVIGGGWDSGGPDGGGWVIAGIAGGGRVRNCSEAGSFWAETGGGGCARSVGGGLLRDVIGCGSGLDGGGSFLDVDGAISDESFELV